MMIHRALLAATLLLSPLPALAQTPVLSAILDRAGALEPLEVVIVSRGGEVVAERSDAFVVRKIGFERFLGLAATQQPLLYGIAAVILALFTGWLGGVVFRR